MHDACACVRACVHCTAWVQSFTQSSSMPRSTRSPARWNASAAWSRPKLVLRSSGSTSCAHVPLDGCRSKAAGVCVLRVVRRLGVAVRTGCLAACPRGGVGARQQRNWHTPAQMAWNVFVVLCMRRWLVLCALHCLQPSAASLHGDVGVMGQGDQSQSHVACSLEVSVVRAQCPSGQRNVSARCPAPRS